MWKSTMVKKTHGLSYQNFERNKPKEKTLAILRIFLKLKKKQNFVDEFSQRMIIRRFHLKSAHKKE